MIFFTSGALDVFNVFCSGTSRLEAGEQDSSCLLRPAGCELAERLVADSAMPQKLCDLARGRDADSEHVRP
jgi:hypothetical protein